VGAASRRLLDALVQLVSRDTWLSDAEVAAANASRDRRATHSLLAMLRDARLGADRRSAVVSALAEIDDPRSYAVLQEYVADRSLERYARLAAAEVLTHAPCAPRAEAAAWWAGRADPVLEVAAIRSATRAEEAALLAVLDDPAHDAYADAIEALSFGFDHPRFVCYAVAALSRPDARVRSAAIKAVLYTEPTAAVAPLLALLDDADPVIARDALDMLAWYDDSRAALLGVAAFHARTGSAAAAEIVATIAEVFAVGRASAEAAQHTHLDAWLAPVRSLIADALANTESVSESVADDAPMAGAASSASPPSWCASVEAFCAHFAPIDQPFTVLDAELHTCDWSTVRAAMRPALGDALLAWPDAAVRQHAARAFVAWRDAERLAELLDDPTPFVRKMASYQARHLGRDAALAARLHERFDEGRVLGRDIVETFDSLCATATPDEWHAIARAILADDEVGEDLRGAAVHALREASAVDVARDMMPLLTEPPRFHWAMHAALLELASAHALDTPDLAHLRDADDFALQRALAAYLARR